MSVRSYDLKSRRALILAPENIPRGTFRKLSEDDRRVKAQSLFEPTKSGSSNDEASQKLTDAHLKETPGDVSSRPAKEDRDAQIEKFHTLPKTDSSWDAFEKVASSTISLQDNPSSKVVLRSPNKSRSDASDKRNRHSGGFLGYISRSLGKRHNSTSSDKSPSKRTKPRKKRKSGHRSNSSSGSDKEGSRHREMFEVKGSSEHAEYPTEINELDKVLSMVVNSPGKGNDNYDLDRVTAVVLGAPSDASTSQTKDDRVTLSSGNGDLKYTHFGSPQEMADDDMGHEQCESLSEYSDDIVEISHANVNEIELDNNEDNPNPETPKSRDISVQPERAFSKDGRKSSSSSSSSTSHTSEAQYTLPTSSATHDAANQVPTKFQLEATVVLDPSQSVEQGTMAYFGPVFLNPRKSQDGRNIQILVSPGKGRILRSPTPSEEEQIQADAESQTRLKETSAKSDDEGLADTHTGSTEPGNVKRLSLPSFPCTSLGHIIAGQIQPVGKSGEGEEDGVVAEEKPELIERAIRSGVLADTESSQPKLSNTAHSEDQTTKSSFDEPFKSAVKDRPIPKRRKRSAGSPFSEKHGTNADKIDASSSSSSSSSSDNEENIEGNKYNEELTNCTPLNGVTTTDEQEQDNASEKCQVSPTINNSDDQKAGGSGINIHITPRDTSTSVEEPEIQKFRVKTPDFRERVLDLTQAVKIPVVSVGSLLVETEYLEKEKGTSGTETVADIQVQEPAPILTNEPVRQNIVEEIATCGQSFALESQIDERVINFDSQVYQVKEENITLQPSTEYKTECEIEVEPEQGKSHTFLELIAFSEQNIEDQIEEYISKNNIEDDQANPLIIEADQVSIDQAECVQAVYDFSGDVMEEGTPEDMENSDETGMVNIEGQNQEMETPEKTHTKHLHTNRHEESFESEKTTSSSSNGTFSDKSDKSQDSEQEHIPRITGNKGMDDSINVAIDTVNGHIDSVDGAVRDTDIVNGNVSEEEKIDEKISGDSCNPQSVNQLGNTSKELSTLSHNRHDDVEAPEEKKENSFSSFSSSSSSSGSKKTREKKTIDSQHVNVCICDPEQSEICKNDSWEAVEEAFENDAELKKKNTQDKQERTSDTSNTSTSHDSSHEKIHSCEIDSCTDAQGNPSTADVTEDVTETRILEEETWTETKAEKVESPVCSDRPSYKTGEKEGTCIREKPSPEAIKLDGYLPEHSDKMVLEESVSPFQPASVEKEKSQGEQSLPSSPSLKNDGDDKTSETSASKSTLLKNDKSTEKIKKDKKDKEVKKNKNAKVTQDNNNKDPKVSKTGKQDQEHKASKTNQTADTSTSTTSSGDSSGSKSKRTSKLFTWPFRKNKKKDNEEKAFKEEYTDTKSVDQPKSLQELEMQRNSPEDFNPRTSTPKATSSLVVSEADTSDCSSPSKEERHSRAPSESERSSVSRQSSEARSSRRRSSSSSSTSSEDSTPHASRAQSHEGALDTTQTEGFEDVSHHTSFSTSLAASESEKGHNQKEKREDESKQSSVSSYTNASEISEEITKEEFEKPLLSSPTSSVVDDSASLKHKSSKIKDKKTKKRPSDDTSTTTEVSTSQLDTSIASDAHSQNIKEKDKQRRKEKRKKFTEDEKPAASEKDTAKRKEKRTDEEPKKKHEDQDTKDPVKRERRREKNRSENSSKDFKNEPKPSTLSAKPSDETKTKASHNNPPSEQSKDRKDQKEKPTRKKYENKKKVKEEEKTPDSKSRDVESPTKETSQPLKERPMEKPVRRKRDKSKEEVENAMPPTLKHHDDKKEHKRSKSSSSTSSSTSDNEIDTKKMRKTFESVKESKPCEETPLRSEAIELTSRLPPSPQNVEAIRETRKPPTQKEPSKKVEPIRPPRKSGSQKSGRLHKLLPSIRSPSAKEADKKFDKLQDKPPKFDGQYHREDDISHDVDDDGKPEMYTSSPRQDQPEYSEPRHFVVVAIDFGTTHSGYAFSFTRDPSSVYMMRRWAGEEPGVVNQKTLTSLLLTPEGEFHSFGYSARSNYLNLVPLEARHWMYFSTFKMELHHNSDLNRDTQLVASNGVRHSALRVFAHSLRFFKSHALQQLGDQAGTELLDQDIRWVITVPAIWKPPAKQFMRQAAYEAGLASQSFPEQLLIALEPEAASIYCRRLRMHQLVPEQPINRPLLSPRNASCEVVNQDLAVTDLSVGSRYLIVDCGGGTVDITVHELDTSGHITELHRATGGPFGSTGVDTEFERLLCGIFGIEFVEHYKRKYPMGWVHLMTDFESRKRSASPFKSTSLNVSPPFTFINDYKKHK
ncbi:heat shock 70 kda protein 12a, partial [Plakobranchus ocellatus]